MGKRSAKTINTGYQKIPAMILSELKKNSPLISVVIATHNRQDLLPQAVDSILHQTYSNFEIIIVDDCSTDGTSRVIDGLVQIDGRINAFRSEKNIGPGAARNMGISHARGEYIAIMDDDDISLPQRLEKEIEVFKNDPQVMIVFSSVAWVDDDLNPMGVFPDVVSKGEFPTDSVGVFSLLYLEGHKIPNTSLLMKRKIWEKVQYPSSPWIGEDWYLCLQLSALGMKFSAIDEPLVLMRRGLGRQGLLQGSKKNRFFYEKQVLRMIKSWLIERGISAFDDLYNKAVANQILRESSHYNFVKGSVKIIHAFIIDPTNTNINLSLRRQIHNITRHN